MKKSCKIHSRNAIFPQTTNLVHVWTLLEALQLRNINHDGYMKRSFSCDLFLEAPRLQLSVPLTVTVCSAALLVRRENWVVAVTVTRSISALTDAYLLRLYKLHYLWQNNIQKLCFRASVYNYYSMLFNNDLIEWVWYLFQIFVHTYVYIYINIMSICTTYFAAKINFVSTLYLIQLLYASGIYIMFCILIVFRR